MLLMVFGKGSYFDKCLLIMLSVKYPSKTHLQPSFSELTDDPLATFKHCAAEVLKELTSTNATTRTIISFVSVRISKFRFSFTKVKISERY